MNAQHKSMRGQTLSRRCIATLLLIALLSVVVRAAPGDLDPTFSGDGKQTDRLSELDCGGLAVAVQADGRVVAVGWSDNGSDDDFALIRYNSDGSLDTSFDGDGKVTTPIGMASAVGSDPDDEAYAVAIQSDGKIVVAGTSQSLGNNDFAVVRYNPDGSLDTSFDGDGKVTTPIGSGADSANALAIQSDGKIVVSGSGSNDPSSSYFAVVRYNPNGSLDTSFDGDGKVTTPMGTGYDGASAVAIQSDGKIVAVGSGSTSSSSFSAVVRYNSDGSLDTSFDGDGKVTTQVGSGYNVARSVAIQSDGKIVAAGISGTSGSFSTSFAVARYNNDGSLDTSFDGDGKVTTSISSGYDGATAVAIRPDGKLVVTGSSSGSTDDFAIVRYNTDGSLDTTFGGGDGNTTVDFNDSTDLAWGMALDGQGRAVVVGNSDGAFALARFLLEPNKAHFDFDGDGRSDVSVFRPSDSVWYIDRSSEGFTSAQFGISTDKITPADYDGDGKTDISIFRDGTWWRINSGNSTVEAVQFGIAGDIPVPGDYNGDGHDELAVYRSGQWWLEGTGRTDFGIATDQPVPADYDGDGKTDISIYRDGAWWRINSSNSTVSVMQFGIATDRPVVGDYDGDSKADLAVYRDGTWYLQQSTAEFRAVQWGLSTDIPAPADYDGDGKTDAAVYRNGSWYLLQSTAGMSIKQFGLVGDKPAPSAFVPSL